MQRRGAAPPFCRYVLEVWKEAIMPNKSEEQKASETHIHDIQKAGGPFVAVAERTRMPMLFLDPQLPGNPIIYANDSFLSLTGFG